MKTLDNQVKWEYLNEVSTTFSTIQDEHTLYMVIQSSFLS